MDLRNMSDENLRSGIKKHVAEERNATSAVLHHLKEIDRRRLFSEWKFASLHEYAEKELSYSSDEAYRRIAAMKLLKELPEIEAKINSGSLSLTNIAMARTLFRKENLSREEKLDLIEQIDSKSTRAAAKIIATISPEVNLFERTRPVTEEKSEYKFYASHALEEKFEALKAALAHSHPGITTGELIENLADLGLDKFVAPQKASSRQRPESNAGILRQIRERDGNTCTNCGSDYAIETDHVIPRAVGGQSTLENQRLLCRSCNQRAAIEYFGINKMTKYLKEPVARYG